MPASDAHGPLPKFTEEPITPAPSIAPHHGVNVQVREDQGTPVNEIAKVFSSLLLLGAGFVGASMFGPPDLVDQFAAQWKVVPRDDPQALRPLEAGVPNAPSQLPMMVAKATPMANQQAIGSQGTNGLAGNGSQVGSIAPGPIRQMASHANVPQAGPQGQLSNQRASTIWNDQTQVQPAPRSSDQWLNAIHQDSNVSPIQSANASANYPSLAALPLNTPQLNSSQQARSVDATSPDAWGVPNWDESNRFASQSSGPDSSNQLLSPPGFARPELQAPAVESTTASNAENESFWNRPPSGPRNNVRDDFQSARIEAEQPSTQNDSNTFASNDFENEFYEPIRQERQEPSPFGQIEAPAVQRINLPAGPERTHVVTDGDTLPMLAERYLGDAGRAQEIYQLNQDRLQHPDLLPIGIILRTPQAPARRVQAQSSTVPNAASQPYTAAWRGEANSTSSNTNTMRSNTSVPNPFSTISEVANAPAMNSTDGGNHRQSQLVPLGQSAELPAAPAPTSVYQSDWSW